MPSAQERFAAGTAVVTGAGAGIGEGLARCLAGYGMHVVVADVDGGRAGQVAEAILRAGGSATDAVVDVADPAAVDALAEDAFARFGGVDVLINNAGLQSAGLMWEIDVDRWQRLMTVNVDGVFHGIRAFVPRMLQAGRPAVVANLSSVGGVGIVPFQSPYIVSKHAVQALTECLRQELDMLGAPIQVSVVLPHFVRSRIFVDAQEAAPSGNQQADAYFAWMQSVGATSALTLAEAAAHILDGIAAGDFWVFSDDDAGRRFTSERAAQLADLALPWDPRERLRGIGVEV
ncbi:SDR family NAD(P)-dependent oxidoreductase [Streptomyces sp. NPDC057580]|uniref:SDR family NAD(P)-dependent oxidoreductase n=1 Tax=Streptomyces sp. NPDC057580 TaxID=3346173 RepID=UPI003674322A